jgi:hypothetical protein
MRTPARARLQEGRRSRRLSAAVVLNRGLRTQRAGIVPVILGHPAERAFSGRSGWRPGACHGHFWASSFSSPVLGAIVLKSPPRELRTTAPRSDADRSRSRAGCRCVLAPPDVQSATVSIRTLWRRLWEVPDVVRSPNAECPLCGAGVVVEPNAYGGVTLGCGSVLSPRPRQELIAACAKHGRSPYNDKTVKYYAQAATATGGPLDT